MFSLGSAATGRAAGDVCVGRAAEAQQALFIRVRNRLGFFFFVVRHLVLHNKTARNTIQLSCFRQFRYPAHINACSMLSSFIFTPAVATPAPHPAHFAQPARPRQQARGTAWFDLLGWMQQLFLSSPAPPKDPGLQRSLSAGRQGNLPWVVASRPPLPL